MYSRICFGVCGILYLGYEVKVKIKQSRYRPGQAQTVAGSYGSQIS